MVSDGKMSGMGVFMQKVSQQRFLLQISKVLEKELHLFFHICIFRQQIFFFFCDNLGLWSQETVPLFFVACGSGCDDLSIPVLCWKQ